MRVILNMLTCVCRPVSSSFIENQSIMGAPIDRDQAVVTQEPKNKSTLTNNQKPKVIASNHFESMHEFIYVILSYITNNLLFSVKCQMPISFCVAHGVKQRVS